MDAMIGCARRPPAAPGQDQSENSSILLYDSFKSSNSTAAKLNRTSTPHIVGSIVCRHSYSTSAKVRATSTLWLCLSKGICRCGVADACEMAASKFNPETNFVSTSRKVVLRLDQVTEHPGILFTEICWLYYPVLTVDVFFASGRFRFDEQHGGYVAASISIAHHITSVFVTLCCTYLNGW